MQSSSILSSGTMRPAYLQRPVAPRLAIKPAALPNRRCGRLADSVQFCSLLAWFSLPWQLLSRPDVGVRCRHMHVVTAATTSGGPSREEARAKQTGVSRGGETTSSTGTPGAIQPSSYAASPASRGEHRLLASHLPQPQHACSSLLTAFISFSKYCYDRQQICHLLGNGIAQLAPITSHLFFLSRAFLPRDGNAKAAVGKASCLQYQTSWNVIGG